MGVKIRRKIGDRGGVEGRKNKNKVGSITKDIQC